jgi:hypothetical protein
LEKTEKEFFFKPGITFSFRAPRFAPFVLPAGCIFAMVGQSMFPIKPSLLGLMAVTNSNTFNKLISFRLGRDDLLPHYTPDTVNPVPFPAMIPKEAERLALEIINKIRTFYFINETSRFFIAHFIILLITKVFLK